MNLFNAFAIKKKMGSFKWVKTGKNSCFSISDTSYRTNAKESNVSSYLSVAGRKTDKFCFVVLWPINLSMLCNAKAILLEGQ